MLPGVGLIDDGKVSLETDLRHRSWSNSGVPSQGLVCPGDVVQNHTSSVDSELFGVIFIPFFGVGI